MSKYFIPPAISLLYLWVKKFRDTIPTHESALSLTPEQVTDLQASCDAILSKIDAVIAAEDSLKSARTDRDNTIKLERASIANAIAKLKLTDGYTEAIGEDLGVIGEAGTFDPGSYKPILKGEAFPGYVRLAYKRYQVDGLNFYSRIKGTSDWKFIGFDIESPMHDTIALAETNKPETREYSAIGVLNDVEVGQRSDIVVVTFGG